MSALSFNEFRYKYSGIQRYQIHVQIKFVMYTNFHSFNQKF